MAKNSNDKYYTPPEVVKKVMEVLKRYFPKAKEIIEPSAGDGAFIPAIKETGIPYAFYDLYPEHPEIEKMDFKELKLGYRPGRIFVGNPPFGHASSLFKRFVKGACEMGDGAVYVGPASHWNAKWGWKGLRLVYSEHLGDVEYYTSEGNGEAKKVNTCLNVYMRGEEEKDDRMERLSRDVEITNNFYKNVKKEDNTFYINAWGRINNIDLEKENFNRKTFISVRVINKELYNDIEDFIKNMTTNKDLLRKISNNNMSQKNPNVCLTLGFLKQKLAEWLYPTREERLERDVEIIMINTSKTLPNKEYNADYFMNVWGDSSFGKISRTPETTLTFKINILNEERRKDIEEFLYGFREMYLDEIKENRSSSVASLQKSVLKQKLSEYLYPEDEYGYSFYNEKDLPIKKAEPVHAAIALF